MDLERSGALAVEGAVCQQGQRDVADQLIGCPLIPAGFEAGRFGVEAGLDSGELCCGGLEPHCALLIGLGEEPHPS